MLRGNRRRSFSTRHSSALSPYSPHSPTRFSSPSSVSSRGLAPHRSLSRPSRRTYSISGSHNRRQSDELASPVLRNSTSRKMPSSGGMRRQQSFILARSPLPCASCHTHQNPLPRPQSFVSSSFSSTPSPILRARSLGTSCRSQHSSAHPSPSVHSKPSPVKLRGSADVVLNHASRESSTSPRRRPSGGSQLAEYSSPRGSKVFATPRTPSKRSPQKHTPQSKHFSPRKISAQKLSPLKRIHSPHSSVHSPLSSLDPNSMSPKHSLSPAPSPHVRAAHTPSPQKTLSHIRSSPQKRPSPQKRSPQASPPKRSPRPSPQKQLTYPRSTLAAPRHHANSPPAQRKHSSPAKLSDIATTAPRSRSSPIKPTATQFVSTPHPPHHEKVPWWRSLVRKEGKPKPNTKVDASALSVWRRFCQSCKVTQNAPT